MRPYAKIMLIMAFTLVLSGCLTRSVRTTTTTETITSQPGENNKGNLAQGNQPGAQRQEKPDVLVRKTKVEKEEKTQGESRGILGTTLHFAGQVLAFPFKVIAGVIEFIF